MKRRITNLIKEISPSIAVDLYRKLYRTMWRSSATFEGSYKTWEEARKASGGYHSDVILNKVQDSLLKVKNGISAYERDSVLFDEVQYSWPVLAGLLWIASRNNNKLNLIDFGGSLGSSYYQNRKFLSHLTNLTWSIVEQEKFVERGKQHFENSHLKFYHDLDTCIGEQHPDSILFSGVIQYLDKPYELLMNVLQRRLTYVIFDRTPFLEQGDDRITVQQVPMEIYPASYPAWFFNQKKFLDYFSREYELIADFESNDRANIPSVFKGFIFKLKRP